ncbi:VaFE repeat-containing surface-anchored protein, partial [Arcanobacterium phocae]|uniref:VaFE repeat-containing surface-anchored protein n=1 Tax=Arcanobacterium phocae TaxID=131112 RepID=UPI001C10DAB8
MKSNAFGVGETYRGFIKEGVDAHDIFVASEDGKFVHQAFCYDKTKEQPSVLVSKEDFEERAFSAAKYDGSVFEYKKREINVDSLNGLLPESSPYKVKQEDLGNADGQDRIEELREILEKVFFYTQGQSEQTTYRYDGVDIPVRDFVWLITNDYTSEAPKAIVEKALAELQQKPAPTGTFTLQLFESKSSSGKVQNLISGSTKDPGIERKSLEIGTTAFFEGGSKSQTLTSSKEKALIKDKVTFTNLPSGYFELYSWIVRQSDGKLVEDSIKTTKFSSLDFHVGGEISKTVDLPIPATEIAKQFAEKRSKNEKYVVYEALFRSGEILTSTSEVPDVRKALAVHFSRYSSFQAVEVKYQPGSDITSKASVGADGQKEAVVAPNSKISISDKFTANNIPIDQPYQNFPSTSSYRVTTSVVEHAGTANVGNPVAEKIQEFTINNPNNGTVPYVSDVLISEGKEFVSFSFETGDISIPNEKLNTGKHVFTVFQKIEKSVGYQQWETVAEHANLEDENQTVRVTVGPEVQTKATFPKETSSNPKVLTINEGTQEAVVADMLQLQYFEKGKTYRAVAELVDSFTGKTVLATGISEPITITEDLQTAIVSIPLTKEAINKIAVNASSHYTVLERIYETDQIIDGKLKENAPIVAEHTQLDAHSQMVTIARAMPVAPKPSISTVAQVDGEKSVELDGVKPVGVVDTVKWENLPVGHYVAEATYVVDGKDESKLVVGSKSFEVTAEDAAKGSVDVALTIPESALTADGKPVKFTVLERVFKADIAGEKTGDAVAEHVDKKSVEQTVTVTVKKPVAPKPSISTVAQVDGEKVVELDGVKPVGVVDTVKWENLPVGHYVAEATYVVDGKDESKLV